MRSHEQTTLNKSAQHTKGRGSRSDDNSLLVISVTLDTSQLSRGWLNLKALKNTVHQYKGKKHTKETQQKGESEITRADNLEQEGTTHEREGEI